MFFPTFSIIRSKTDRTSKKNTANSHPLGTPEKNKHIPAVSADKTKQASAGSRRLFLYIRRTIIPAIQRIAVKKGKGFAYPTAVRSK